MADSDCIVVMGSNMAENHPVAFRWPMKAKVEHGAKIIHVDPRFTRTSAVADIYAPVRAGSDIAFLGGVIKYVLDSEKWNNDPFFKTFVVNYTNAATIINEDFKDTEDLDGVFSGLLQSKGGVNEWPFNGFINQYDGATWQYARTKVGAQGEAAAATARSGETIVSTGADGKKDTTHTGSHARAGKAVPGPAVRAAGGIAGKAADTERRDAPEPAYGFSDRQTAFRPLHAGDGGENHRLPQGNVSKSRRDHSGQFGRGSDDFIRLCRCLDAAHLRSPNHRRLRAASASPGEYRPAGRGRHGAPRPRLHPGLDGRSYALPLDPGLYVGADGAQEARHACKITSRSRRLPTGYWANMPKFVVSYMKSVYGEAATKENQFGWDWHPKILGDHSHMAMFVAMNAGAVKGMFCVGQNPATSLNAKLDRSALRKLEWLVVKDNWLTETATFWKNAPEVKNGEVKTADIKTEVFFLPATQVAEIEGTFTNTQRLLQFHHKAAEAPGDCRSDTWFYYDLGKRLKKLYAQSTAAARRGV